MATAIAKLPDGGTLTLDDQRWAALESEAPTRGAPLPRLAYAAAHIVMRDTYADAPHSPAARGSSAEIAGHIDWDATAAFRRRLVSLGFGIAEAMDTAQRFEIGWPVALELIQRCAALKPTTGFVAGAGTDQRQSIAGPSDLIDAVVEQCEIIRNAGGVPIILPMAWLSLNNAGPDVYVNVYTAIARQSRGPIFLHWLGPMFLESLAGYFPGDSLERILAAEPAKIRGIKLSLLDEQLELRMRPRLLERNQIILTGDDFNFASLIEGTGAPMRTTEIDARQVALGDFSHALLGILDGVAAPASLALRLLAAGRRTEYRTIMSRCERLGREIFQAPTPNYKAGLAFLSWLNGLQPNHMLPNHVERSRSAAHYLEVARLANEAGAIVDAPTAAERLERFAASIIA